MEILKVSNTQVEMARVGYTADNYEIYVYTDDPGKIPHFHYRNAGDWSKFHTCIKIESAEYFHHGNKMDVLDARQRKELDAFLRKRSTARYFDGTNWDRIVSLWEENNSDVSVDADVPMPDYTQLR